MEALASAELAATGLALVWFGARLRRRPEWFDRLCALLVSPPPGPVERRRLPWIAAGTGAGFLLAAAGELYPYPHGARPYAATALEVLLLAASAASAAGLFAWITVLRRLGRRRT